jgi:hypothetical protein
MVSVNDIIFKYYCVTEFIISTRIECQRQFANIKGCVFQIRSEG